MPIFEYVPVSGECDQCDGRFEVYQKIRGLHLKWCPTCGQACKRALSAFSTPRAPTNPSSVSHGDHAAAHGFSTYKRTGQGHYTKTSGAAGPKVITEEGVERYHATVEARANKKAASEGDDA